MGNRAIRRWLALAALCLTGACGEARPDPAAPEQTVTASSLAVAAAPDAPALGIMSSLPLYWPLEADVTDLASGTAPRPWQRSVMEQRYRLVPLDTLSPVSGLSSTDPAIDPLADLDRLAVIQPRGLSPADNVALDRWVRAGGRLVLMLDPALTGAYEFPLGDPRRPIDTALIPPVVARWGLSVNFDESQPDEPQQAILDGKDLTVLLAGQLAISDPAAAQCELLANNRVARCALGDGYVTIVADAAIFEHPEIAGPKGERLLALLDFGFE